MQQAQELVGVSEAARLLDRNKSTISRQVAKGIIPNHAAAGQPPLINIEEARQALRHNIDTSKSATRGVGLRAGDDLFEAEDDVEAALPDEPVAGGPDKDRLSYNTARTAAVALQAQRAQLELMRELGQLVPASEVERAAQDHARSLRDRLLGLPQQIAGELSGQTDERKIIAILTAALKACLTDAVKMMEQDPNGDLGGDLGHV